MTNLTKQEFIKEIKKRGFKKNYDLSDCTGYSYLVNKIFLIIDKKKNRSSFLGIKISYGNVEIKAYRADEALKLLKFIMEEL